MGDFLTRCNWGIQLRARLLSLLVPSTVNSTSLDFLSLADKQEKDYNWLASAQTYSEFLRGSSEEESHKRGIIHEQCGYAFYRAATQANGQGEFSSRMTRATAEFRNAIRLFRKENSPEERARELRCKAMVSHLRYWLTSDVGEKKRLVNDSWSITKDSLEAFQLSGNSLEYGRTYNQLSSNAFLSLSYSWTFRTRYRILKQAVAYGIKAINLLSNLGNKYELGRAYLTTASYLCWLAKYDPDVEQKEELIQKARAYWLEARGLAEETADIWTASIEAYQLYSACTPQETVDSVERTLSLARKTGDHWAMGIALSFLVCLEWDEQLLQTEDPNERLARAKQAREHSEEARYHYRLVGFTSPLGFFYSLWERSPEAEYYRRIGEDIEIDPGERRTMLLRAVESAEDMLRQAEHSGYPDVILASRYIYSRALSGLARTEDSREERERLLDAAMVYAKESLELIGRLKPWDYFDYGVYHNFIAEIESELAGAQRDPHKKARMIREAVKHQEAGIILARKDMSRWEKQGWAFYIATLATWQYKFANLLGQLHDLSKDRSHLEKAAEASTDAVQLFAKVDQTLRMAECYWKSAQLYDLLADRTRAYENFVLASRNYGIASERIPQLKTYYRDYSSYMRSWSEIEEGRYAHEREECESAMQHYHVAADLLESTGQWRLLALNYRAWAKLEEGEDLSAEERHEKAVLCFAEAGKMFSQSKVTLSANLSQSENSDNKVMLTGLIHASEQRQRYCAARTLIEEARALDKQADHLASAEKYRGASLTFEKLANALGLEPEGRGIRLMVILSRAWEKMARGEGHASEKLFSESYRLFDDARRICLNEKMRMIILGHSRYCRAAGALLGFVDGGSQKLRLSAVKDLESAANHYLKAGSIKAFEHIQGVKLLLDAYMYVRLASTGTDQAKKVRIYNLAEKLLRSSAKHFAEAGYEGRKEEAVKLLDRVGVERNLAISLVDVLRMPVGTPVIRALPTPRASHERPVGLEAFEHANLQTRVKADDPFLTPGQEARLVIEITNAGKSPARLIKLEGVVPEGFRLSGSSEKLDLRGTGIDLKGRWLEPLKTEQISMVLIPKAEGLFTLEPSVLYTDYAESLRSHLVEPIDLVVSPMLEFLISCFVDDYVEKRRPLEQSGWRSLMDIVDALRVPRSQVYGDARYGRRFAAPIEVLVKERLVELRVFTGQRGRGGEISRLRISYNLEAIRRLMDDFPRRVQRRILEAAKAGVLKKAEGHN